MFKQRVITSLILVALLASGYLFLSTHHYILALSLIIAVAAWEWAGLAGWNKTWQKILYALSLMVCAYIFTELSINNENSLFTITAMATVWWIYALVELRERSSLFKFTLRKSVAGLLVLLPVWWCAAYLLMAGPSGFQVLFYVVTLVVVADTTAYFSGRAFGVHKMAPAISPGKTIEGAIGGLAGVVVLSVVSGLAVWDMKPGDILTLSLLSVIAGIFSIVGDLFESKLKRSMGMKDSGRLLPGHGGVLDRIDALTAALPVFTFGWIVLIRIKL